jgi:hypothetical protein
MNERSLVRVGSCEFVMRLLARVTGEKSEAMYVWRRFWRVPFLKKKKIETQDFQGRTRKLNKNSVGPGIKKIHATIPKKLGSGREPPPGMFVDSWFPTKQS